MSMQATPEAIVAVLAKEAGIAPERLQPEATLASLEIASLDLVTALFAIEDEFGLAVDGDEAARAETLGDLIAIILKAPAA